MLKIFKTKIQKLIAVLTATSLLISFVVGPTAASAINNDQTAKEYSQIFKEFILPYSYGKITKSHFAGTDRVIINIQDLHCHPKVQKNIANIIETFDKKYGVNNIYLEGAYGDVSTNWITDQMKRDKNLLEKMLDTGRLTGAEYYSALSGNTEIIKGLEEKEPYLDNIARLGSILDSQEKIDLILKSLDESVNEVKKQYYSKRQYKLERLFEDYKQGKITSQKYYTLLSKHIEKLGIDLTKYENSLIYLTLLSLQKDLDYQKITAELQGLVSVLKQQLPYNIYKSLLENTSNFQELEKFYSYVIQLDKSYDLNISLRFSELNKYFGYIELSKKLNPVELLKEDEFLSQEINTRFSQTPSQKDVVFLVYFGRYLRDYVTTKITLEDYKYYKENIEEYRKVYNKYVDNRVLSLLDEYIAQIDKFYEINMDRNLYFTRNMFEEKEQFVQIEQVKQAFDDINRIISNMDEVKRVDVVVTGGFHSQTVTELLEQQNVSYIVITPNVTDGIKLAEETYYELAKEQSKISFQTIAPVIASLSPQLQSVLLSKIESKNTEKIEQIMKKDESEIAQTIADLAAAKLLESDDLGDLEETLNEIVENLVDEYHKEKVTPELVSEIKNLQKVLKDKEKLQKIIDLLSEGSAKQSVMLVSDMFAVLYKRISDILVPSADKERLEKDEDILPLKDFDADEDFGDSDIEKDGAYEDDEYYGYDVFDSLDLWFSDAELRELSREIIKEGQYNENIEKFIEYLGRHNMADYELLSKILAELKSINNSEIKKEYCGVLYALTDKKVFNDKQKAAKNKEDIMSFLEKPRNIQLRFCELFPKVFAGHDDTVYSFFTALLDCVNENEYTNTDFDFLVTVCRYSFLVTDLETKENMYNFLTLNIEKRRLLYSFYQAPKVHTDIEINRVTLNFMLSVLHKYNLTDEQFNYIMKLICSVNITKNTFEQKYVNNLKEKELNIFVLENFKYINSYSRYLLDLIFSDVEETKVENFVSKLQKIVDLFDDLQEYKIDTLDTENKCFALEVFLDDGFEAYCKDNNINDLVKQYQLAIRVSRKIYSILGDKISTTPIDKMDNIIKKTLEYYKKVDKIISFLTLFTNKTAIFSLHNNERNPDKKSFRFTPDGIKEILKRLEIEPEVFESIEISFMDKVLDFIRKIEQDEIDKQVLLDFVNNLDGSVIVKKDILEYLAKKKNSTISKKSIIRYVTRLKISERFVEVNRYLKLIERFNDYGQEKGVFIFDGHGASDGKSISYSETGSVTVHQIAQALINAHNNGVNLENLTLVFASCHSYKFADNIINELIRNGIDSFPQILTDAGKETIYGYTKAVDMDGKQTKVSNLFYSLLKLLDSKTQEEIEQMKGSLSFKDVADAPRYLSNNTVFVTNQEINKLNNELEADILDIINEQESENTESPVKNDVAYAGRYSFYAEMMLPSTQRTLNKIGNIGIIKAVYKEKSGENFKFTTLGVALGVLIETFSFWSPNFIKVHNFDPSIQAGMTAVVWAVRALSIGIGFATGTIWAIFLTETITHFIWNMAVILIGRQDLLLQTSKTEEITIPKQESKEENGRDFSQEEIDKFEHHLQTTILQKDIQYQYQPNPELKENVEEIFGNLLDAMVAQGKITAEERQQYRIHYYFSPVANAYTVINSKDVFIFSELLYELAEQMNKEGKELTKDHIAAILAHELQHTTQKNRVYTDYKATKGDDKRKEYDADRESIFILEQAGYNPRAVEEIMSALIPLSRTDVLSAFFDAHPNTEDRLKEISEILEDPSLVFLSMTKTQQPLNISSLQKYGQDFQEYLNANFDKGTSRVYSLDEKLLQKILDETDFFEKMSIFDIGKYIGNNKNFIINTVLNGNYKFFTKAENDFIKSCSAEEKEFIYSLLFATSAGFFYSNTDDDNNIIKNLENAQKTRLFDFCINVLDPTKIKNDDILFNMVATMNPTQATLKAFLDFRKINNIIISSYTKENAYFYLTNYKYLTERELSSLLEELIKKNDDIFSLSFESDSDSDFNMSDYSLSDIFESFSQEQKNESLKLILTILTENKDLFFICKDPVGFMNSVLNSDVLTKQEKLEYLLKLSKHMEKHKSRLGYELLDLFDELNSDKTDFEKLVHLFEVLNASENNYYLAQIFSYSELISRYKIFEHDFDAEELKNFAFAIKNFTVKFDIFFLGYFLKLKNPNVKFYFTTQFESYFDKKYSDGICLYPEIDVEKLDRNLLKDITLDDLIEFQNFMMDNHYYCHNISLLANFVADNILNLNAAEKVKIKKLLTLLPKGENHISIKGNVSAIPYEHLKNLVDMQIFYKDIDEQTREVPKSETETSFIAFYVPFLEFRTFNPDYYAVSFEQMVENIKNHFDAYDYLRELEKEDQDKLEIYYSEGIEKMGNPNVPEERIRNMEIEKAWLVELHKIFSLSPEERKVEFNYGEETLVYTYFEINEQLFNNVNLVPTAQQAQQLVNAFSIIKKELPQEMVDVYAKLVYSLLKRNSNLSVFSSAKNNLELLDLLFEDFSVVKDDYITELLDSYDVSVEEYKEIISKTRLYFFSLNSEDNNKNVSSMEIINTILPTMSDSEKIKFFFWLLSGNDSYKPQMLKQVKISNFKYEGEINFDSLQQSFRLMTKTERENFIRRILLGKSGILEKGKASAERNGKEFEQGLKNVLFDDFFLSSLGSSKIKASSISIVFKEVFSIVFNNLSDERKVLFVNNLISALAEIKSSDEKDGDEQKARQLGRLIVALGTSSGVAVVKLLQILSNNKIFEALDDKYGSVINEEVAKVKDENEPLSKSVLFQYLEKLGLSAVIDYVGKRLGAASIGLTYLLKLKNIKDLLVAKVKRPNINKTYDEDFKIAEKLIEYFKSSRSLLDDIYKKTLPEASTLKSLFDRELNFEEEAENLDDFSEQLKNRNSKIRVPQLIKVINGTTVYNQNLFLQTTAKGTTLDKIKASKKQKSRIYSEVLKEFFTEIFVDPIENGQALYHADLHTGNIFVDENGTISFIDLGGVGKVSAQQSKALKDIFMFLYAGKYNDFINALKSYNSKLYEDLEHEKALNKIEEILNRKTSLESKFVDLFEIFNSLENIDSDFMMFIQAISKISGYLDKLDKKDQLTLLNNLSFDRNIQFKIIADNILTYIVSAFKKIQFNKKQQEESQEITQEDIFREKLLSIYPDMSSEDIDLLLSLDPVVLEYIKNNTFNLTQQQLIMCGPLADKLYKRKIITEQNNKMNLLFKIAATTTFSEKNIEKLLALDENTIEKIISEITEDEKIEILFTKAEQFNINLVYKNEDFFNGNKNFERALMFAKGDKLNKSQSMMYFVDADSELIKAKILFGVLPAILTEELLRNDRKLNSLYHIVKDIKLSLEEDGDAIEILALLTETEIDNIEFELRTLSDSSNKNVKRFLSLYKDYRDIFSKKGESTTLAAFVTNNQNDGQIREFFDLAIKNNSIETIKSISHTDISLDISLSSEFALKIILFRSKAFGIPIDKNDSNFSDMIEILKNISSTGKERILNLDEDTYTKLFSIKNNETLIGLLKHISKYSYYDRRDFEYLLNEALLAETKDTSSVEQQQIPEEFVNLTDDYNQFEHMENLPDFAETKTEEEKRQNAVEFFNDQIESIASQSYQFAFMGNTKYLYLLQNRKNKDSLLNIVSNANINLKFRLLALLYLDKLGSKDLTPAENANIESYEKEIVKELKKQIENNEFKVLNNLDLRAYMMGVYLILRDFAHRKKVPYLIDNALIINFSDGVMAKDNGLFAEVDLFIVIHELTHRMFDKPKNGYQLVDDALDELVSYIVPNVFLRKIIKLSFDAYSQRQKRYTIHQTNGVIDYVNMGVKFRSLYSMFDEKANEYEIEQEVHSGPLAFLDYLFKAHQKIGKPVNWDALLDVISYLRISRMDQLQVFREILNMYFIYTTEDNLLTKEDTEKIKKEIEKMQTWTILVREILELIESVSPDTFNLLKGRDTPSDYKNEILSKTNKAKESFEEISRAYQMKYQFSKNDLTVMLILDVLKNVEYEQLENNFDGVIAGIIDVINNAAENYSIDLNKQTFDRSDYLKLSAFVKSSFVVAENKGTSIKDNIIAYISKNLGQVLFVEPLINKIFGTKNLRYVFGNKKVLVTRSAEQTDRLNKILNENNINNTTVVTMEIVKAQTTDIRDGIYLDVTKGIKAKYDEDTNTITVYSKKGIADTENIEELIMRQYFSERNEDSFNDVIAFANVNDSSMQDITERLNNAYTDSVSIPGKETNFDLSSRTIKNLKTMCNQEFVSTDIKTFIITSKQAKDFAKDITSLQKQGFKFIVSCKIDDITDITNYDGLIIDDSATDYEDISQLLTLMEKVKKQVLTQGVAKQVYVKFSNPTYQQFNSMNINIFDTYGIVPIVLNSYMVNSIIGKCAVEKITEETIDRLMRQNNIVGLVVDDARIFSGRKNKLRETNTKEQKYNKGYNASLSSKFDYTCNDVKLLADYLTIDITDDNALKELDKLVENLHNDSSELYSSLSLDSRAYLGYLAGKGRYEEMLGFIRGIAMNSARTQIIKGLNAKEVNLDMDKFAKEAGGKYQKAFLTVAVQLMMEDIDITELLETDFIDSDMTVKQYLDSVYEKVNINIEDILKQNEFKIERAKDTAKTIEDFKNYVVLLDNLKIIKETTANFNMSMKAVRGILSAA